jgi:hypothetical protein
LENNPLFYHAPCFEVRDKLQALYDELIKKHNPEIAQKLYVNIRIHDMVVDRMPFTIKKLPILEVYTVNDFTRKVAKLVTKE